VRVLLLSVFLGIFVQGETGRVEVVVRDSVTTELLVGFPVTLTYKFPNEPAGLSSTVFTDPRGMALFSGLVTGRYLITSESFATLRTEDSIVVIDPGDRKRVDIGVTPLATVTVRVVDTDGKPIRDALVQLPTVTWVDGRRLLREFPRMSHENGEEGVFRILQVPFGEYYLRIENPSPSTPRPNENPLPMITYYPGVEDFHLAVPVVVRRQKIDVGEVRLVRQKVFKVSGTIVRPASPRVVNPVSPSRDSLRLFVRFHDTGSPEDLFPLGPPRPVTVGDAQETRFEIGGLPPGTHSLYPMLVTGAGGTRGVRETPGTVVTVTNQDVEGLRIVMPESVTPTGRVVVDESTSNLLRGIRLVLRSSEPIPIGSQPVLTPRIIVPDARSGEFTLQDLSDGVRYSLVLNGLGADAYVHDIRLNNLSIFNEGSFIASTREQRLELEIRTKGSVIRGVVHDATNEHVEKASVVLIPELPRRGNPLLYKRTITDASGTFAFNGVAPGDYQVLALRVAIPAGAEEDPEFLMPNFGRGAAVRATEGSTSETQLRIVEAR